MERKEVLIKNIIIGNGQRIAIQSMTNTISSDYQSTISQVNKLKELGCDIVRISLPTLEAANSLSGIIKNTDIPIVADVHFDYKIALQAIISGVHKLRINPSNFPHNYLSEVVHAAKTENIPIRVGVNRGSVHKFISNEQLAEYALSNVLLLEKMGFDNIVVSAKTSNVKDSIIVNNYLYNHTPYPIHIGLTEAGIGKFAEIKSIYSLSVLLNEGIGDTIRISLTGNPEREVKLAQYLLRAAGKLDNFFEVVACPTCARTQIDVEKISNSLENKYENLNKNIKISIMGCSVNGIGEGLNSDIGICGGKDNSVLFLNGKKVKTVKNTEIEQVLVEVIDNFEEYN
jgi:(E)-4-hydroxy-3-methylbut-2-enyl-diphosphate synthase